MWGVRSSSTTISVAILLSAFAGCTEDNATDGAYFAYDSGAGGSVLPASGGVGGATRGSGGTAGAQQGSGSTSQSGGASPATGGASSDASVQSGGAPNGDASVGSGGVSESGGAPPGSGGSSSGGVGNTGGTAAGAAPGTGGTAMGGAQSTGGAPTGGRSNTGGAPTGGVSNTGGAPTGGVSNTGGAPTGGVSNTGGAPTGGVASTGGAQATGGAGGSPTGCLSTPLMTKLGKSHVLVGASMSDATATAAPFDMRYLYLAGGIFDGTSACQSCATGCTAKGVSCANSVGCAWWGCWQWDQDPPGAYARGFFGTAVSNAQFPMITYYEMYAAAGNVEGAAEVAATNNAAVMHRYIADWKFVIDQVAGRRVFLHIEPDFWGFAEQVNQNPHLIPAAVASAHSECAGFENSIAGLGRCMIDMVRRHAPTALVGLHGSGWATKIDVLQNRNANLDVVGEANKLGSFLSECGAGSSDFVVVDPSDRDAAWYESQGQNRWWDATNATLPNFHQGFTWAKALAERVGVPIVWWQVPVGNMSQNNTNQHWRDNRVDYFFGHMGEVAASHGVALLFGAGDGAQTTPETDGGNLIAKMKAYAGARTAACP